MAKVGLLWMRALTYGQLAMSARNVRRSPTCSGFVFWLDQLDDLEDGISRSPIAPAVALAKVGLLWMRALTWAY